MENSPVPSLSLSLCKRALSFSPLPSLLACLLFFSRALSFSLSLSPSVSVPYLFLPCPLYWRALSFSPVVRKNFLPRYGKSREKN